jgi:hypothetical protein
VTIPSRAPRRPQAAGSGELMRRCRRLRFRLLLPSGRRIDPRAGLVLCLQRAPSKRSAMIAISEMTAIRSLPVGATPVCWSVCKTIFKLRECHHRRLACHTQGMKAYQVRRAQRGRSDPGDLGWIVVCAIDARRRLPIHRRDRRRPGLALNDALMLRSEAPMPFWRLRCGRPS